MGKAICPKVYLTSLPFEFDVVKDGLEKGASVMIESEAIPEGKNQRIAADSYGSIITAFLVHGEKGNAASFSTVIKSREGDVKKAGVSFEELKEPRTINVVGGNNQTPPDQTAPT